MNYTDLLLENDAIKQAAPDNPNQQQLEQDFANLSYMFLQDRAPLLLPYLLGFETVEQNVDGSKAVGVFGFKVGNNLYYVPSFFINGQVKGMDVIFDKKSNRAMALTEPQVLNIIDKDKLELSGTAVDTDVRQDFESPNLDFVSSPPHHNYGGGSMKMAWAQIANDVMTSLEKDSLFQESLQGAIKAATGEKPEYSDRSELRDYFSKRGGPDKVKVFFDALCKDTKLASAALAVYPSLEALYVSEFDENLRPKTAKEKVTVVHSNISDLPDDMDEVDKEKLVRDGMAIIDRRADSEKSEVFEVSTAQYSNPTEPGLYNVLCDGGVITKLWVIPTEGKDAAIISEDGKISATRPLCRVYTLGDRLKGCDELGEIGKPLENVELYQNVIVILDDGKVVGRYNFVSGTQQDGKFRQLNATSCPALGGDDEYDSLDNRRTVSLSLSHPKGSILRKGSKVMINASARYVPCDIWGGADITLGDPSDLEFELHKAAFASLVVESDDLGGSFNVDVNGFTGANMGAADARVYLVRDVGLGVEKADRAIKTASADYKYRAWVKRAQTVNMNMPPLDPNTATGVDDWTGAQIVEPDLQALGGEAIGRNAIDTDERPPDGTGGQTGSEMNATDLAGELSQLTQAAAESGQRSVFDHGTIGSLARLYESSEVIDQYLPELRVANDRLGRLIFLFNWQNGDFEERYGAEEMAEIESRLRNTHKMLTDLYLRLKNKAVDSGDESTSFR